jgi:hypothetical protein
MAMVAPVLLGWAAQYAQERRGRGAVFGDCIKNGVGPQRAKDRACECVQEAIEKVLKQYGEQPEHYDGGYPHFCNSVTRTAIHCARDQLRRERRHLDMLERLAEAGPKAIDPRIEAIRVCREMLPEPWRTLLEVKYVDDGTLDEMAELLPPDESSDNARRLRVWRELPKAEAVLRELLERHYPDLQWGNI